MTQDDCRAWNNADDNERSSHDAFSTKRRICFIFCPTSSRNFDSYSSTYLHWVFFLRLCRPPSVIHIHTRVFFFFFTRINDKNVNFELFPKTPFFSLKGFSENTPSTLNTDRVSIETDRRSNFTVTRRISEKHTNRKRHGTVSVPNS